MNFNYVRLCGIFAIVVQCVGNAYRQWNHCKADSRTILLSFIREMVQNRFENCLPKRVAESNTKCWLITEVELTHNNSLLWILMTNFLAVRLILLFLFPSAYSEVFSAYGEITQPPFSYIIDLFRMFREHRMLRMRRQHYKCWNVIKRNRKQGWLG